MTARLRPIPALLALAGLGAAAPLAAQSAAALAERFAAATAVSGYEDALADTIAALLPGATRDRFGNVTVTLGRGAPRRLVSCGLDEPGYVVGNITPDGYLTLRRSGRAASRDFDEFVEGQRVTVWGRTGPVPGVVGVRSVHLARGRPMASAPFTADDAFVDVGAASAADVAALGIGILTPVARAKAPQVYGGGQYLAAPAAAGRAECAALAAVVLSRPRVRGTVVAAFTVQSLVAGDPGRRAVEALQGPFTDTLVAELPAAYAGTPVESVQLSNLADLEANIAQWIAGGTPGGSPARPAAFAALPAPAAVLGAADSLAETAQILGALIGAYGVSGSESAVRATVERLLPAWAKPQTDTAGNLWLTVGSGEPTTVYVAHMDEIGFVVRAIGDDGRLTLENRGGFFPFLFAAEPALVHTPKGDVPGVFTPADTTRPPMRGEAAYQVNLGVASRAAAEALGVTVGSFVTMPKQFVRFAGDRATGRSMDDRVGCTALILAVRHLDRAALKHKVIFIWSTREEIGLDGARAAANALGTGPVRVHAIDTFVSADAPLEHTNFADAKLGAGAVARALDNSSVTPAARVDTLAAIARARGIALQVGSTGGGNDGSTFAPYGVVDVAMGWPLRYSHSPAEVVDLRDVLSLGRLVAATAEGW